MQHQELAVGHCRCIGAALFAVEGRYFAKNFTGTDDSENDFFAVAGQRAYFDAAPQYRHQALAGRPFGKNLPAGRVLFHSGISDQRVDFLRRHSGREALAVFPLRGDRAADPLPVAALERRAHLDDRVANPLEAIEDLAVAVEMTLGNVPVVGPGVARRAGIGEDDVLLELVRIDMQRHPLDPVGAQLDCGRPLAAVRCAFWIGVGLASRGEIGRAGGWLGRAQRVVDEWPDPVTRIALVGHSLGGLVIRAASAVVSDVEAPWSDRR